MRNDYSIKLKLVSRAGGMMVEHPNGSSLWLSGCDDRSEIDKFRGQPFKRALIDEAQKYGPWLRELITESIDPGLADLQGTLALSGTPSPTPIGYFYEVTTGGVKGYAPAHHWTVLDNPYMPHARAYLEEQRELNGWTEDSPTYRREWLGE